MLVRFWGVRGSIPSPLSASQIRSKISTVVERLRPCDLETPESRERFLSSLPPWLFGTSGGNTPCVEVRTQKNEVLIFDAGSGIRELGIAASKETPKPHAYSIFFSHFHWDHIQGLPFFAPAYDSGSTLDFYSPVTELENILRSQMSQPTFPVGMDVMAARKNFYHLDHEISFGSTSVSYRKMNHPGASYSFSVTEGSKRFIYATDTELSSEDFYKTKENASFFEGAELLVIDSQYTLGEAIEKYNWGHSAFSMAVDFASTWGIKKLVLFHHDPTYDDKKLFGIQQSARWYMEHMSIHGIDVNLAVEGSEIQL
jgi:phosphoribosyl 1,2-cyclic phosphodiesterase